MKQATTYNDVPKYKGTGEPALLNPYEMEFKEAAPVISYNDISSEKIVLVGYSKIGMEFRYYITEEQVVRGLEEQVRQVNKRKVIKNAERLIMASAAEIGQGRPEFKSIHAKVYVLAGEFEPVMIVSPETYTRMLKIEM